VGRRLRLIRAGRPEPRSRKLVTEFSTGEFAMSTVVVAAGELYVSTWDPFQSPDGAGYRQAFSP
jgi:hypothetical protein